MDFTICLANRHTLIHSIFPGVYELCERFLVQGVPIPDMEVCSNMESISAEAERIRVQTGQVFSPSYVEQMMVLRQIAEALLPFDTLLMHGAVVAINGTAYMFTAKSGTGKTTLIRNWLKRIKNAYVVNGDKPFIILRGSGELPLACGSPWAGKENLYTNTMVPLKSIILMERAEDNRIERASFDEAFPFLMQQIYQPDEEAQMRKTLLLLQSLDSAVTFWRFHFNNFKDNCFDVAYNALVRDQP